MDSLNNLSGLFDKFKGLLHSELGKKTRISDIIFTHTKIRITPSQIVYREPSFFIQADPVIKNELFLRRAVIEREIEKEFGLSRVTIR